MRYLRWLGVATGLMMVGFAIMVIADLGTGIETKDISPPPGTFGVTYTETVTTISPSLVLAVMALASGIALIVVSVAMFRASKNSN